MNKLLLNALFFVVLYSPLFAQTTIYSEDFSSQSTGAVTTNTTSFPYQVLNAGTCTASDSWEFQTGDASGTSCNDCAGLRAAISFSGSCSQDATLMTGTFTPSGTAIDVRFYYGYDDFGASDQFDVILYNETAGSGTTILSLNADADDATYSNTETVVAGNIYTLRFRYIGDNDWGATVDDILVTENCIAPTITTTVVPDCGNNQYSIDVVLTNFGDGTGVDLSDGTTTITNATLSTTYTFGPYSSTGPSQTIQAIGNNYGGCTFTSGTLSGCAPTAHNIPVTGIDNITTCNARLYDNGGPTGNPAHNSSGVQVVCPNNPTTQATEFNILAFDVYHDNDFINIYNGNSTVATLLATFNETAEAAAVGQTFTSTDASGCLTLEYISNGWGNQDPGWEIAASCACKIPTYTTNIINNCAAGNYSVEVVLNSFGAGTGVDLSDGTTTVSNAALSTTYTFGPYASTAIANIAINASSYGGCATNTGAISGCVPDICSDALDILGNTIPVDFNQANNDLNETDGIGEPNTFSMGNGNTMSKCSGGPQHSAYYYTDYTDLWYSVDIPNGSAEFTVTLTGLTCPVAVIPYTGSCGSLTMMNIGPLGSGGIVDNDGDNTTGDMPILNSDGAIKYIGSDVAAASTGTIYLRVIPHDNRASGTNCNAADITYCAFTIAASSPQENDVCNTAVDITINNGGTASSGDLSAGTDEGINCLAGVTGRDLWYNVSNIVSSAPNYNGPYTVQFTADGQTGEQMIVQLIDGCFNCGSITVLAMDTLTFASPDSTDFGGFQLSGGISDYKIRVVEHGGSTTNFTASAKLKVVNDNCDYFNNVVTAFSLWNSSGNTPNTRNVNMEFATGGDLFYNFSSLLTAPVYSGTVDFNIAGLGTNESITIEVYERTPLYSTDCNNLTLVGTALSTSSDGTFRYDCLNEFEGDYLVRVVNTGSADAVFTLSAQPSNPVPVNDRCSNIWNGSSVTFNGSAFDLTGTTLNADFTSARDCDNYSSVCSGVDLTADKDLWFHFTIPADNCPNIASSSKITDVTLTYDASNAFRDARIFVYSDCGDANLLDCSGSLDGAGDNFTVSGLNTGQTYLVRIKPSSLNSNNDYSFDLSATLGPLRPCNDRSADVIDLGNVLATGFDRNTCLNGPFSAQGATSSTTPASGRDVWLSFIAPNPANGQSYQIPESYLTIYLQSLSSSGGNPYPLNIRVYEEVGLNNAIGVPMGEGAVGGGSSLVTTNTNGDAWLSLGHLVPGEDYFIRISHTQPETEEVLYNLCLFESAEQEICNTNTIDIGGGVECSNDCSKYFKIVLPDNTPSGFWRFEAIGNNGIDVNMRMFFQPNETLGTNEGDITDVDQACGVQSLVTKVAQGALPDPGTCNGGTGNFGVFNLIGAVPGSANLYYLEVYDENNLLGCGGLDLCQVRVQGPYTSSALAQVGGAPDATCAASLPVELLYFDAKNKGYQNTITWSTASETNNDYFVVEKSNDGINFEALAQVEGQGTTHSNHNYEVIDNDIYPTTYYRLKQVDTDGSSQMSQTIAVDAAQNDDAVTLSPNPATNQIAIRGIEAPVESIVVVDGLGRMYTIRTTTNNNNIALDITTLPTGMYTVQIKTATSLFNKSFIKR